MTGRLQPRDLLVAAAGEALGERALSAAELIGSCLERIERREPEIHAWVELHADDAREQAAALDRHMARCQSNPLVDPALVCPVSQGAREDEQGQAAPWRKP